MSDEELDLDLLRGMKRISAKEQVESVCHVGSGSPPKHTPLVYVHHAHAQHDGDDEQHGKKDDKSRRRKISHDHSAASSLK